MGAVICTQEISTKLGSYFSTFGGNPVSCAIGMAVLEIISNEQLLSSAKNVGKYLRTKFSRLKESHDIVGDHRGMGLVQSIEIVRSKARNTPAPALAAEVMYGLKNKNILVAITGVEKNILLLTPPMCFTIDNGRRLIKSLDEVLSTVMRNIETQPVIVFREGKETGRRDLLKRAIIGGEIEAKRLRSSESDGDCDGYEDMD